MAERFDVELTGCRPEPLASYLKALGILRLVAEQADTEASGYWRGEHFVVRSTLDRQSLLSFFLERWRPTPVVAPWNGGSGFYQKDNCEAAEAILASPDERLRAFAASIAVGRSFIQARGWTERPADEDKRLMISTMRSRLPEEALAWIDAAVVIGDDRLLFPPLLGTGGNDGRLDFSNNFQQRVVEVMTGSSHPALASSLFASPMTTRFQGTMGQYQPASGERTNPWDFVILIEGAMVFAGSATRRFESPSSTTMAFPFHARAAGGVSTVTDSDEDESRDELWLPLWSSATTLREVRRLFAEGRATVGTGDGARAAASALDFARAITALGFDRGIDSFARVGFHVRNGLSYFATPLGRFSTREVRSARLLDDLDDWFVSFRNKSSGKNVPAGIALARRRLEQAMFEATRSGALGPVLLELGEVERALSKSLAFTAKSFLRPVPSLQAAWVTQVTDGSAEQRLAASLSARARIRRRLLPLDPSGRNFGRSDDPGFVFGQQSLLDNLHALLQREDIEAQQQGQDLRVESDRARCSLTDIAAFIDGNVDDVLLERWLRAFSIVEEVASEALPDTVRPPAAFAVLSLVHGRRLGTEKIPRTSGALALACAGDSVGATSAAIRRLNASGRSLPVAAIYEPKARMRRIAAALAFPLTPRQRKTLESMVLSAATDDDPIAGAIPPAQET